MFLLLFAKIEAVLQNDAKQTVFIASNPSTVSTEKDAAVQGDTKTNKVAFH